MKSRLRINKKKAMFITLKEEFPELPDAYIKTKYHRLVRKDYNEETGSSTLWLHQRGIMQCCQCRAWDKIDDRFKICPVCMDHKEQVAKDKFVKFKRKQGLDLELGY
jgi:hypothetical protein